MERHGQASLRLRAESQVPCAVAGATVCKCVALSSSAAGSTHCSHFMQADYSYWAEPHILAGQNGSCWCRVAAGAKRRERSESSCLRRTNNSIQRECALSGASG